ncbi:hypothetical protein [Enterovibrio norvegicus]|uniref:hypothetical protein n=1 Tax=Enterovibrio norvegicus TaxID=188144 RepID=UPI0039AF9E93
MSITNEQILDAVAEMSVMQVVELIEAMEEKFGVTAAAAVVAGGASAEAAAEQTEFDVSLLLLALTRKHKLSKLYVAQLA